MRITSFKTVINNINHLKAKRNLDIENYIDKNIIPLINVVIKKYIGSKGNDIDLKKEKICIPIHLLDINFPYYLTIEKDDVIFRKRLEEKLIKKGWSYKNYKLDFVFPNKIELKLEINEKPKVNKPKEHFIFKIIKKL